jgi:hypothetical protein
MDVFGRFSLLLAFVCAAYAFVGGFFAIKTRHPLLIMSRKSLVLLGARSHRPRKPNRQLACPLGSVLEF